MTESAAGPRKRGRPRGAKDSYQRVRHQNGAPRSVWLPPQGPSKGLVPVTPEQAPPPQHIGLHTSLAQALRDRIWASCQKKKYDPWAAMIDMTRDGDVPVEIQFACHREIAAYLLPKLRAIEVKAEVNHNHRTPLDELLARLEREEEEERKHLPLWHPPAPLDMEPGERGVWEVDEGEDDDEGED